MPKKPPSAESAPSPPFEHGSQEASWERLSAVDAGFLGIEDECNLMHIGGVAVFERGTLIDPNGFVDEARYQRYMSSVLDALPRWRKRLDHVPLLRHPLLVADASFDLTKHVCFEHVEQGSLRDVERIAGVMYSQKLDRSRPLWEQGVVSGLTGQGFATITKVHHSISDGVAGIAALAAMLRTNPDPTILPPIEAHLAQPSKAELLRAELRVLADERKHLLELVERAAQSPDSLRQSARDVVAGFVSVARTAARPAPRTLINPSQVGPRRTFRGLRCDLDEVKAIKRAADVKVNDVVLAVTAGALRRFFEHRGVDLPERDFRCVVPVSLHDSRSGGNALNQVSLMIIPLPLGVADPRERLQAIAAASLSAKSDNQSYAMAVGQRIAEWTPGGLIPWATRLAIAFRPYNIIVTNIAGPPFPLYLLDSRMRAVYPMVPLYGNQALGIALVSYDGGLFWGLSADAELIPDLEVLERAIGAAFNELRAAYGSTETVANDGVLANS